MHDPTEKNLSLVFFSLIRKKYKKVSRTGISLALLFSGNPIQSLWIDQRHVRRRPMWQS